MKTATKTKIDVHQEITNKIVAMMETAGGWKMPWNCLGASFPKRACGQNYRGINVLILAFQAEMMGYTSPYWMTFNQAKKLGGCVKKGEKGTWIVYFAKVSKEELSESGGAEQKSFMIMKSYCVFNANQISGLKDRFYAKAVAKSTFERNEAVELFVKNSGVPVEFGGNSACYFPGLDKIKMPTPESFVDSGSFYGVLCHELVHSTGHQKRLNRDLYCKFGSEEYAFEELVAELGAAFLCADLGIANEVRPCHAEYVGFWIKALKNDKKFIFKACSLASAAAAYLNPVSESEGDEGNE